MTKVVRCSAPCLFVVLISSSSALAQLSPQAAIAGMGRGINMGNTLEPPFEGAWNNGPFQEYYFDDYRDAGFSTVRIPVRWDEHTGRTPPYAVDEAWIDRVEQAVDWGLERDLFIIINAHHDDWIKTGYGDPALRARFDSIWVQIADRFKEKSDSLFFEIINEPQGLTEAQIDDMNARVLGLIRKTNPTRLVIFSGNEWSNAEQLVRAAIPDPDDDFLLGYYHSYDPWDFAGLANGVWGSQSDRNAVAAKFQLVADWSNSTGIPVMISEFGAIRTADFNSRMRHYASYVEEAIKAGIAFQAWDDGGDFQIYRRGERTWRRAKDILICTAPEGPTDLVGSVVEDSVIALTWRIRSAPRSSLSLERAIDDGPFETLVDLDPLATEYFDADVAGGLTYYYRVISHFPPAASLCSYPIQVVLDPFERSGFRDSPAEIPGVVEAEDYDVGGEGLTYHDTTPENIPGGYRPQEGVDVEARDDGGFHVGYVEPGEWFEAVVRVIEAGRYVVTADVASLEGGGSMQVAIGEATTRVMNVPQTGDWMTTTQVSRPITLEAGEQFMRTTILSIPHFNIDRIRVEKMEATRSESGEIPTNQVELELYPNPATGRLIVSGKRSDVNGPMTIRIFNALGQLVHQEGMSDEAVTVPVDRLPAGVYAVKLLAVDGSTLARKMVLVQ